MHVWSCPGRSLIGYLLVTSFFGYFSTWQQSSYSGVANEAGASLGNFCINLMPVSTKLGFQTAGPLYYSISAICFC